MRVAGLDENESIKLKAAFTRGYGRSQGTFFALMRAMKRQADEAIGLHDFLVEIHPRLSWSMSANTLEFANAEDQRTYDYRARQLDAATKAVEAIQERAQAAANAIATSR